MRYFLEKLSCDAPGCGVTVTVDTVRVRGLEQGWIRCDVPTGSNSSWVFEFCPLHGRELKEAVAERQKTTGDPLTYVPA